MTAQQSGGHPAGCGRGPGAAAAPGPARPAARRIANAVLFVALRGVFGLLPRLGGLTRDAGLRHARPAFLAAAVVAQAVRSAATPALPAGPGSARGADPVPGGGGVILATFFVSHLTPFGSATGTLVNASTLKADGIAAATTGEAIGLTSLTSTIALIVLFGTGFVATAGRHLSRQYLLIAGIVLVLVAAALAAVLAMGAHPAVAGRAARWAASWPGTSGRASTPTRPPNSSRLASLARTALTGRAFAVSFGFASGDLLFDLLSLDLVFLALRYQPGFGPLAVAYAAANIASAIPLTPGGLGVIEVTLVAVTVGFGAPRATRCWPYSATGW